MLWYVYEVLWIRINWSILNRVVNRGENCNKMMSYERLGLWVLTMVNWGILCQLCVFLVVLLTCPYVLLEEDIGGGRKLMRFSFFRALQNAPEKIRVGYTQGYTREWVYKEAEADARIILVSEPVAKRNSIYCVSCTFWGLKSQYQYLQPRNLVTCLLY